jgi:hypothetical protein
MTQMPGTGTMATVQPSTNHDKKRTTAKNEKDSNHHQDPRMMGQTRCSMVHMQARWHAGEAAHTGGSTGRGSSMHRRGSAHMTGVPTILHQDSRLFLFIHAALSTTGGGLTNNLNCITH